MDFNKKKCLKLLKERKNLRKEGKLLWDYDKTKADELTSYISLLEDQIFWESRKEYVQLLKSFYNKKISFDEFYLPFCGLRGSNRKAARMLTEKLEAEACGILTKSNEIDIQFNPKSYGFTKIISDLHSLGDIYNPDVTLEMNLKDTEELLWYGMSEEYLRLTFEEDFLPQLEKYCKKSNISYNISLLTKIILSFTFTTASQTASASVKPTYF
jgi:hypothetical protein